MSEEQLNPDASHRCMLKTVGTVAWMWQKGIAAEAL